MSVFQLIYWSEKEAADCPAALYVSLTLKFCLPFAACNNYSLSI